DRPVCSTTHRRDGRACWAADLSRAQAPGAFRRRVRRDQAPRRRWSKRSAVRVRGTGGMATDIDRDGVAKVYGRWAPIYDVVFGKVFDHGRQSTIAEADRIGGRILDVGVGTGLSLSDYSPTTRLCGVDISEPMLRKAQGRVRALGLKNVETLAVM